ncbi:hypothetical protein BRADI_2g18110v3 [Brachypodium distachyon]|uniref:RBR-type E3 ubiquitin transferase n=1 Tax=Brachypodium distachyon TaxID=15368 RepID=A0A0Q3IXC4_BRADI|nr:hypothetical protein BRADI_2g18110v3 [Brachypodium distachyon]
MAGGDELAALHEQAVLASCAAVSASDLDLAFQLQVAEAIQASLRTNGNPSSSNAATAVASSSFQPAPALESSDVAYAMAIQAADACRAHHALAAASVRVAAHDALFARELAAVPEDKWARDGDNIERPLDPARPLFRVFFKGMSSKEMVGPRERDPGVAVLAVAVCGPRGEVVLRIQKPVEASVGGRMTLEVLALNEALHAALGLGIRSIKIVTDYKLLGIWRPAQKKLADMINQVLLVRKNFEKCEILLVERSQLQYGRKLAMDSLGSQIAKAIAVNAGMGMRENCPICLEDTDVSKIHAVEGCSHRFCFSCMKEHVKVKLLHGMLPACPQDGCTKQLTVEGSKVFLSPRLLGIMVQRIREGQIPPTQKVYCPYPKCSALMSLSEVIQPMEASSSKYTAADAATLRKCIKCRGSFCIRCKVPWHDRLTCYQYKIMYPDAQSEDAKLKNLAKHWMWRNCAKCNHMIELAEGCYHI